MRKLRPGHIGPMRSRVLAYVPTEELGWLTPLRPAAAGLGYYWFRCRCGAEISKLARNIRTQVQNGSTPKCSLKCRGVPAAAAAEAAQ